MGFALIKLRAFALDVEVGQQLGFALMKWRAFVLDVEVVCVSSSPVQCSTFCANALARTSVEIDWRPKHAKAT